MKKITTAIAIIMLALSLTNCKKEPLVKQLPTPPSVEHNVNFFWSYTQGNGILNAVSCLINGVYQQPASKPFLCIGSAHSSDSLKITVGTLISAYSTNVKLNLSAEIAVDGVAVMKKVDTSVITTTNRDTTIYLTLATTVQ